MGQFVHLNEVIQVLSAGKGEFLLPFLLHLKDLGKYRVIFFVITEDVVCPQPIDGEIHLLLKLEHSLTQGILRNAIHGHRIAGSLIGDSSLPITDLMHSAHNCQPGQAALYHLADKAAMGGQILHMA